MDPAHDFIPQKHLLRARFPLKYTGFLMAPPGWRLEQLPGKGTWTDLLVAMDEIWETEHPRNPQGRMEILKSSSLENALEKPSDKS